MIGSQEKTQFFHGLSEALPPLHKKNRPDQPVFCIAQPDGALRFSGQALDSLTAACPLSIQQHIQRRQEQVMAHDAGAHR